MFFAILDYTINCACNKISRKYSKRLTVYMQRLTQVRNCAFFARSKPTDLEVTRSGILYLIYSIIMFASHIRIENVSA